MNGKSIARPLAAKEPCKTIRNRATSPSATKAITLITVKTIPIKGIKAKSPSIQEITNPSISIMSSQSSIISP